MKQVTVDGIWISRLPNLEETVEVRDPAGRLLGHFTPALSPEHARQYALARQLFDLDEAERISAAERGQGVSFEEVMKHLKSLETRGCATPSSGHPQP